MKIVHTIFYVYTIKWWYFKVMLGTSVYNNYGKDSEHSFNVKPGLLQKFYEFGKGTDSFQIINILNRPLTRGEVRLNSSNPADPPLLDPKYLDNYEDVKVMVESKIIFFILVFLI